MGVKHSSVNISKVKRICPLCNTIFIDGTYNKTKKYCSGKCDRKARAINSAQKKIDEKIKNNDLRKYLKTKERKAL
jgi:predicted RNA-binding Zn ribbon-like protein